MSKKKLKTDVIAEVAENHGVKVEKVRKEMESAIKKAYKNKDTRSNWDEIFGKGVLPSTEEFLVTMAERINHKS